MQALVTVVSFDDREIVPAIHGTGPAVTKPMRRILGCAYRDYVPPAEPEKPKPRWAGVGGNLTGDDGYTSST